MEKPIENTEKQDEGTENKKKSVKIDGVSSQINLVPNSQRHRRFARLMTDSGIDSPNEFMQLLMDAYEYPVSNADDQATIANLEKQLEDARNESMSYSNTCGDYANEIADLKKQLEEAQKMANDNAVNGLGKQAQIEDLQKQLEGAIIVKPNPVSAYFLNEMSAKTGKSPAKILEKLFSDDLQEPRANNLPYSVEGWRIREVMEQLKPKP